MRLNLANLNVLKLKMAEEKEIAVAYNYFFDHFGENDEFLDVGKPARNEVLEAVLGQTVAQIMNLKSPFTIQKLVMIHLPDHAFYHGGCFIGGRMVNFIYFDDIQLGCIALAYKIGNSSVQMLRFSTRILPQQTYDTTPN
jgi:hypothetical protein